MTQKALGIKGKIIAKKNYAEKAQMKKISTIQTGDDCIAINSGTSLVNISDIFCGPSHDISIGSLGCNGEDARVEEIDVKNCTFIGTSNEVRVKTWMISSRFVGNVDDIMFCPA
ncbi:hypothetical protein ACSQ67_025781 [Phaseolus vulgaris]